MLKPGSPIGNYRIVELINSGAYGSVYTGKHVIFEDEPIVAIKVLHTNLVSPQDKQMFIQEAQFLKKLKHPHILPIIEAGFHEQFLYLIVEFARNGSLKDRIQRQPLRQFSVEEVTTILGQIGQALHYAHQQNITHRDLKPANILFNATDEALLADFGIAKVLTSGITGQVGIGGTPAYMAPEQFKGIVSLKSDQYALGCIAYELLTGRQPFVVSAPTFEALWYQHRMVEPIPPRQLNPVLSSSMEKAILKAMEKNHSDRHADVAAFMTALQHSSGDIDDEEAESIFSEQAEQTEQTREPIVPARYGNILGISFGATSSCVAVMRGSKPVVIPNAEGESTTPSIVAINRSGERLVGEAAKRQAIMNSADTIYSIKRFMGRKFDDYEVDRDRRLALYRVVRASGEAWVEVRGKAYSPMELSAMILQKLKIDAEAYIGQRIRQAVITAPSYFTIRQRQVLYAAGRIAGLEIIRIINEPVAAALAYGLDKKKDERIAVYNFGGGTCDISILHLGYGVFEVKSTNSDTHLGGDDFDQRVIAWLADEFKLEQGIDLRQDRDALWRLKEAAEKAKKELSSLISTEVNLPFITADASGPKHLMIMLSRSKLEQLVEDLVERSRGLVMKALSDAGVRPEEVNEVVLVGGQTRMPAVQTMVRHIFEREPYRRINPEESAAMGAAIQAGVLSGEVKDVLVLSATSHSLGVETLGGVFTRLIERNTTLPTQKSQIFTVVGDNSRGILMHLSDSDDTLKETSEASPAKPISPLSVEINILQGEREFAKDNHCLGSFILDGISPMSYSVPKVEITFDIDWNEGLKVSARDKDTGREQKITIVAFDDKIDQIDRMVRDAEGYAAEDKRRKEDVEERNLADSAAYRAEKSISELGDRITSEQKAELEGKISDVRAALSTDDVVRLKFAREALEKSFHNISEVIYRLRASVGNQDESLAGDGSIDGEYKEM